MSLNRLRIGILVVLGLLLVLGGGCQSRQGSFSLTEELALIEQDLSYQVNCGPRTPGSPCHQQIQDWIIDNLQKNRWGVETQSFAHLDFTGKNIVGKYGKGEEFIIIGAHYDTRFTSDQEAQPQLRNQPVPGANDGASGVALLLQLSREIPKQFSLEQKTIWLVFFDLEDNGNYPDWDWILGSRAFANSLTQTPTAVVVVDMIGDKDLNIYLEHNSTAELNQEIWAIADQLGYKEFIPQKKYRMIDDHLPFLQQGFPTSLLIDFDYPYWHTTQDTLDKVSARSIYVVYDTLIHWLKEH